MPDTHLVPALIAAAGEQAGWFCQGSRQGRRNEQFRHTSEPWHSQSLPR
jgi:hypothetical protein